MLGWMDAEALRRTLTEGRVTFWSRSRQEYWRKGDTSGHIQLVRGARLDCDGDAVLVRSSRSGPACHTGTRTCFDADDLAPVPGSRGCRVMRRARLLAVVATCGRRARRHLVDADLADGRALDDGGTRSRCPGASAIAVLAPLSLAVLALGGALSIAGLVLRYVFGALTVAIAALLAWLTAAVAFTHPTSAVAATVTEATGIAGEDAVDELVASIEPTAWPFVALVGWVVLLAAGVFALATAHGWRGSGRRYRTDAAARAAPARDGGDVTPA